MDRTCVICHQVIDPERVEHIPETGLCTTHAERAAKLGGEFLIVAGLVATNKQGSLKKNYGAVDVSKFVNDPVIAQLRKEYDATCTSVTFKAEGRKPKEKKVKKTEVQGFDKFGGRVGTSKSAINLAILNGAKTVREIVIGSNQPRKLVMQHVTELFVKGLVEMKKGLKIVPAKRRKCVNQLATH